MDVSPKSRYIPVGGTAKFSCTSKTSSRYSITWSREHNKPLPSSSYVKDGTLIISNARLDDGGTYICTGKNVLNSDRAIISLHVGGRLNLSPFRDFVMPDKSGPLLAMTQPMFRETSHKFSLSSKQGKKMS